MATAKTARETKRNRGETLSTSEEQSISLNEPIREEIERRAYEIYLSREGVHGHDQDDWLQAEREIKEAKSLAARSAS
jgi:DUF2934 family protein